MLTDTHCHLDLEQFDSDREAVLERAAQAGVNHILIPGITAASSREVIKLAESHAGLYAAVGVHPTEAMTWDQETGNYLKALASGRSGALGSFGSSKVRAIGEIGLDYYWNAAPHDLQRDILRQQLNLAAEAGLPVLLHMREAGDAAQGACAVDLLQILDEWCSELRSEKSPLADRPGVLHSFSGSMETAQTAMRLGFLIGVTGPVTFKNAAGRQALVAALPLERILIETDAPFLAPHPQRGKRNEPAFVRLTAEKIALLQACSLEQVAEVTSANAERLFKWSVVTVSK